MKKRKLRIDGHRIMDKLSFNTISIRGLSIKSHSTFFSIASKCISRDAKLAINGAKEELFNP